MGLEEAEGSMLCLYDLGISRVVKAVVIPGRVSVNRFIKCQYGQVPSFFKTQRVLIKKITKCFKSLSRVTKGL